MKAKTFNYNKSKCMWVGGRRAGCACLRTCEWACMCVSVVMHVRTCARAHAHGRVRMRAGARVRVSIVLHTLRALRNEPDLPKAGD